MSIFQMASGGGACAGHGAVLWQMVAIEVVRAATSACWYHNPWPASKPLCQGHLSGIAQSA